MNIAFFFLIIVFIETNCLYVNTRHGDIKERSVLLRKLQSLDDYNSRNASQTQTWSKILADVFVNRIFTFNTLSNEENKTSADESNKTNVLAGGVRFLLEWYKVNIYDKIKNNLAIQNADGKVFTSANKRTEIQNDPKRDVEIIEPKYHGKICEDCNDATHEIEMKKDDCKNGLQRDDNNCLKNVSKFILAIPYQCPIGYRRDWLGYCRISLQ